MTLLVRFAEGTTSVFGFRTFGENSLTLESDAAW